MKKFIEPNYLLQENSENVNSASTKPTFTLPLDSEWVQYLQSLCLAFFFEIAGKIPTVATRGRSFMGPGKILPLSKAFVEIRPTLRGLSIFGTTILTRWGTLEKDKEISRKEGLEPLGGWLERPSNQHPRFWRGKAPVTLWALSEYFEQN